MIEKQLITQINDFIQGKLNSGWTALDNNILSGCEMQPIAILFMNIPGDLWYGHVHAYMKYNDRIFQLIYRVHVPNMKSNKCANDPQCMYEWVLEEFKGVTFAQRKDSDFGHMAYWDHTSTRSLDGDDLVLRHVFDALKKWSVSNHMCKELRKTDRKHLSIMNANQRGAM